LQFWVLGDCTPPPGNHCYVYYNGTLATLDGLFWILVVSTIIVALDLALLRIIPSR
jgi:hypothetical protein